MALSLDRPLAVATCIGCGARSRGGECDGGCVDVALDLVEVADVEAMRRRVDGLRARLAVLRPLAEAIADADEAAWPAVREQSRAALREPAAPPAPDEPVVEAWGCPECGRIDAPQPCLGICVRRPVEMIDAAPYRELAAQEAPLAEADAELTALARLVAQVRPRPGQEARTLEALHARANAALALANPRATSRRRMKP